MIYITDNRTAEQRKAAEAESKKPLSWTEYQSALRTAPTPEKRRGLINRLQMETVPAELKGLFEDLKRDKR